MWNFLGRARINLPIGQCSKTSNSLSQNKQALLTEYKQGGWTSWSTMVPSILTRSMTL